MKKAVFLSFIMSLMAIGLCAQIVEVEGKLKVTEMDTTNGATMLVVRQPNGTLATRMAGSLPPPHDTMRTLQSDLLLTSVLCNCSSLPPAMIESLLDHGYSYQDLIDFQISILELLDAGLFIQDLVDGGISIQALLDGGQPPIDLFDAGVLLDSLYGKTYAGGLIFYLDTINGTGLVAAPSDQSTSAEWGCSGTDIPGAADIYGTGAQNTIEIVAGCTTSGIAADLCANLNLNGFTDWFLPSLDILYPMNSNIGRDANGSNQNIGGFEEDYYWSSSQQSANSAYVLDLSSFMETGRDKSSTSRVRAIRAF